jgi:hypothetical protein
MTMPVESPNKPAGPPPDKPNRFRPEMPQIPGVHDARPVAPTKAVDPKSNAARLMQVGTLAAAVLLSVVVLLWWVKSATRSTPDPAALATADEVSDPPPATPAPDVPAADGPTVAATAEELAKPWSAKQFTYLRPVTHENLEAMVIRLPGGRLWAFALHEPYGRCDLEYITDLGQLLKKYGYNASHPMVASPCSNTIYDPLKVGALGGNIWSRGAIVQGGGMRPPISIDAIEKGRSILADRIE